MESTEQIEKPAEPAQPEAVDLDKSSGNEEPNKEEEPRENPANESSPAEANAASNPAQISNINKTENQLGGNEDEDKEGSAEQPADEPKIEDESSSDSADKSRDRDSEKNEENSLLKEQDKDIAEAHPESSQSMVSPN